MSATLATIDHEMVGDTVDYEDEDWNSGRVFTRQLDITAAHPMPDGRITVGVWQMRAPRAAVLFACEDALTGETFMLTDIDLGVEGAS